MDVDILLLINKGLSSDFFDYFFKILSSRVFFALPILIFLLAYFYKKLNQDGLKLWCLMVIMLIIADAGGNVIKNATSFQRPCFEIPEQIFQPSRPKGGPCGGNNKAMPSNHTLNYFTLATFLAVLIPRWPWQISAFVIAFFVGLSRIYLGKHYPGQVFVGAGLGIIIGYSSILLYLKCFAFMRRIKPKLNQ